MKRIKNPACQPALETLEDRRLLASGCTLSFYFSSSEAWENHGRSCLVAINRQGDASGEVSVRISSKDITTTAGRDYSAGPVNTVLNFANGECRKYYQFPVINDGIPEADERLQLKLSSPTGGAVLGRITTENIVIRDNDSSLELWNVNYAGTHFHPIVADGDPTTVFNSNQWLDLNHDGDTSDPNDRHQPICYAADGQLSATARFWMARPPGYDSSRAPDPCLIRAIGNDGTTISATTAALTESGQTITLRSGKAAHPFGSQVKNDKIFHLVWQFSYDHGKTWLNAGISRNQLYITAHDPSASVTMFQTTVDIGCSSASGLTASQNALVIQDVWNHFRFRDVKRVGSNTALKYYGNHATENITTESLLKTGDGQCGAWSRFFRDVLVAQGIVGVNIVRVTAWDAGLNVATNFLVNNWTFQGSGTFTSNDSRIQLYRYRLNLAAQSDSTQTEVVNVPNSGLAGQGGTDPKKDFSQHFIVQINGGYYDPSYGGAALPFASQQAWENASIAGYFINYRVSPTTVVTIVKPNNTPTKTETRFLVVSA